MTLHRAALAICSSMLLTPAFAAPRVPLMMKTRPAAPALKRGTNPAIRAQARGLRSAQGNLKRILAEQSADPHAAQVLAHSATSGNYYVVSDLHMGLGRVTPNAAFDRQEDFTRPDVWKRTMEHISTQPGHNTLVIGGDMLDVLEHVNPSDGLGKVKGAIGDMIHGHAQEWTSLARAVVDHGLRVVYIRGNHDIRMLDATAVADGGAPLRQTFLDEVMKTAKLTPEEQVTFKQRVAFAGHAAPLGKFGEMMVYHGEQQDPTNSWRNPANPYSYSSSGRRRIPSTFGDHVVRDIWVDVERADPDGDNTTESSTKVVAHKVLTDPREMGDAAKLLWQISKERPDHGPAESLAERIDDRTVLQTWAERTGFTQMMNASDHGERKLSSRDYAKQLEKVYATQPTPLQDRMESKFHTVNALSLITHKKSLLKGVDDAEPRFLQSLTETMPNVKYVVAGHDHKERIRVGTMKDRGEVGFFDSGTWTKAGGEDRLNIVVAHTNAQGRIDASPSVFRVNPSNGKPEFPTRAFEELNGVQGWSTPKR